MDISSTRLPLAAALLGLMASITAPALADTTDTARIIQTAQGAVQGIHVAGVDQYRGMPYAQAPIGNLRWVAPQAPLPWQGVRDGSRFGAACPQARGPLADNGPQSEDCLWLNVYVPPTATGASKPVILWVHGSGTVLGSGSYYDASKLALATDAVVVTFNYRLGAFGWLWTTGMQGEAKGHNFALQDQQAAMRWVQRNIAAFGGDPSQVTLAGQSIGATSVSVHLASPTAAGLFQRAFLASGVEAPGLLSSDKMAASGDTFAQQLGCAAGASQMACLRAKSVDDILAKSPTYDDIGRIGVPWHNFVDGQVVTQDVLKAVSKGQFNKVPIMVGSTLDDGRGFIPYSYELDGTAMTDAEYKTAISGFVGASLQPLLTGLLYPVSKYGAPDLAASQVLTDVFACQANELGKRASPIVPVFQYEFADRTAPKYIDDPFMDQGAYHGSDLLYWFQTPVGGAPLALNATQQQLSSQMLRYFMRFVHHGDPNWSDLTEMTDPRWLAFNALDKPWLTWTPAGAQISAGGGFQRDHQCGAWSFFIALRLMGLA
jgi:para-nitrobenzyl esterase